MKKYEVRAAKSEKPLMTGTLQEFDHWWHANRTTFGTWSVLQDDETKKIVVVEAPV